MKIASPWIKLSILWLILLLLSPQLRASLPSETIQVGEAEFAQHYQDLPLRGSGIATWMRIFDVYAAALYAPENSQAKELLSSNQPFVLEISYLRSLEATQLIEAASVALQRQHSTEILQRHADNIAALHAHYRDVDFGDRFRLAIRPNEGLYLFFNDRLVSKIRDDEFARFYVGIWLGEPPLSERLKTQLFAG